MIKELIFMLCMYTPLIFGVRNSIEIMPKQVVSSDYMAKIEKKGVVRKKGENEVDYFTIINIKLTNKKNSDFVFKLSDIMLFDKKNERVRICRNIPAHVLNIDIIIKPNDSLVLDLYFVTLDVNDKIEFAGLEKK